MKENTKEGETIILKMIAIEFSTQSGGSFSKVLFPIDSLILLCE
jgi:hypothetical protein